MAAKMTIQDALKIAINRLDNEVKGHNIRQAEHLRRGGKTWDDPAYRKFTEAARMLYDLHMSEAMRLPDPEAARLLEDNLWDLT